MLLLINLLLLSLCYSYNDFNSFKQKSKRLYAFTSPFLGSSNVNKAIWSPRVQKIKDISLQKDILRDITAAEFALKIEAKQNSKDQIIDYDKLLIKLEDDLIQLEKRQSSLLNDETLIPRIINLKEDLILASQNLPLKYNLNSLITEDIILNTTTTSSSNSSNSNTVNIENASSKVKEFTKNLLITVREDGSVDWDEALASGKEVAKFGTELWERLNGKEEGTPTIAELFGQVQVQPLQSIEIDRLTDIVNAATKDLSNQQILKDELKLKLRKDYKFNEIITKEALLELKKLDTRVKELTKRLKLLAVNLDMEKICLYLQKELESSLEASEQKALIAEVVLIDKQLNAIMSVIPEHILCNDLVFESSSIVSTTNNHISNNELINASSSTSSKSISSSNNSIDSKDFIDKITADYLALVDEDELNIISIEVNDLKSRLGLETQLIPNMNWGSIGIYVTENLNKIKIGLNFFSDGTKLLISDIQYVYTMLLKAIQGYTLKPREVNAIRRTGKDLLTLIPFTIILLIPLSPVGHVLVFTFIQRFFPDFYPSCYTEKRLNLRKLFSEVEIKNNIDILGNDNYNEWKLNNNIDSIKNFFIFIQDSIKKIINNNIITNEK